MPFRREGGVPGRLARRGAKGPASAAEKRGSAVPRKPSLSLGKTGAVENHRPVWFQPFAHFQSGVSL
jgi:hypothetical protein